MVTAALASRTWLAILGILYMASLIPVVWAIVDIARRPLGQFSRVRKAVWTVLLGVGVLFLWPLGPLSSLWYLLVLRRRLPPAATQPRNPMADHRYGWPGRYGPYGAGPYGPQNPYGPGPQPQGPPGSQQPQVSQGPYGPYGPGSDPYGYRPPPAHLPLAGWYPDPAGSAQERWWDGRGWSDHLRDRSPGPPA